MKKDWVVRIVLVAAAFVVLAIPGSAAVMASCTPDFSQCQIPENVLLQLPFTAIAGDVIVLESNHTTVSDVFRIFNNVIDTTGGTGLGNLAFLYSQDDSTPLPNPSTYSANAVSIQEDPSGYTHYLGNGTDYLLNAPEPASFGLLSIGIAAAGLLLRRRAKS